MQEARRRTARAADNALYRRLTVAGSSGLVSAFTGRIRTCFTMQEFVSAVRETLELSLDASVLLIRSNTWEQLYASPAALTSDPGLVPVLKRNYRELSEGFVFMDERYNLTVSNKNARGFFVFCKGYYLFVFTRICPYVDQDVFRVLYGELLIFFDRVLTVSKLFEIAALTKDWRQVAQTQRTFLPEMLPEQPKLTLAAYWRPLVNVSGDYYDAIRLDDNRTLLVIGDVSGKGLGAALITGIVLNTIRAVAATADLRHIVRSCDAAIRQLGMQDKYTVMFVGLVDIDRKRLDYINAVMADQFIVARTVRGPAIKRLASNSSIVGLLDDPELVIDDLELRTDDVIVLATDGLTEIQRADGLSVEDSPDFARALGSGLDSTVDDLVGRLALFGETWAPDRGLHDDLTIVAAKVGRLWA